MVFVFFFSDFVTIWFYCSSKNVTDLTGECLKTLQQPGLHVLNIMVISYLCKLKVLSTCYSNITLFGFYFGIFLYSVGSVKAK